MIIKETQGTGEPIQKKQSSRGQAGTNAFSTCWADCVTRARAAPQTHCPSLTASSSPSHRWGTKHWDGQWLAQSYTLLWTCDSSTSGLIGPMNLITKTERQGFCEAERMQCGCGERTSRDEVKVQVGWKLVLELILEHSQSANGVIFNRRLAGITGLWRDYGSKWTHPADGEGQLPLLGINYNSMSPIPSFLSFLLSPAQAYIRLRSCPHQEQRRLISVIRTTLVCSHTTGGSMIDTDFGKLGVSNQVK